jgi:hypothetical protein
MATGLIERLHPLIFLNAKKGTTFDVTLYTDLRKRAHQLKQEIEGGRHTLKKAAQLVGALEDERTFINAQSVARGRRAQIIRYIKPFYSMKDIGVPYFLADKKTAVFKLQPSPEGDEQIAKIAEFVRYVHARSPSGIRIEESPRDYYAHYIKLTKGEMTLPEAVRKILHSRQ